MIISYLASKNRVKTHFTLKMEGSLSNSHFMSHVLFYTFAFLVLALPVVHSAGVTRHYKFDVYMSIVVMHYICDLFVF